ncbi:MAG: sigma-70 family RNA polymerase sigma factor [Phycisphaerae bacterium]|jgi:RNA polymerase sigma factor (sigma-70 family)|nr:sigma-70 family RNA polymerase sigma factor [Phycisphaerae bacterium]
MKATTNKMTRRKVRPPVDATILTGRQLSHLQKIAASQECVLHPSFELSCTEAELFGPDAPEIKINSWASFPGLHGDMNTRHQGDTKLRTADEVRLFLRYNYARYRLARLGRMPGRRSSHARTAEMHRWYQRAMRLRSQLTGANLALVIAMAKRTKIPDVDFSELISEGNMALLGAIEKFDVSRGFKFSTYACRVILKSFSRLATNSSKHRRRFGVEFDPSMEPGDQVEIKRTTVRNDALSRLHEILLRNHADLSTPEQRVIDRRFALTEGGKKKTLAVVGKEMGVSKERIRQIQRSALAKLRRAFRDDRLSF